MVKKVFIYGDKVINDRIPDSTDVVDMLRQMNDEIETRKEVQRLSSSEAREEIRRLRREKTERIVARAKQASRYTERKDKRSGNSSGYIARRVPFRARVTIHKNNRSVKGTSIDISESGIFVKADKGVFGLGEAVNLRIKPTNNRASYNIIARVKRFCYGPLGQKGYGLEFVNVS